MRAVARWKGEEVPTATLPVCITVKSVDEALVTTLNNEVVVASPLNTDVVEKPQTVRVAVGVEVPMPTRRF